MSHPSGSAGGSRITDWFLLIAGAASFAFVNIGGQLYFSELVLLLVAVIGVIARLRTVVPAYFWVCLVLWFIATITSDMIAASDQGDALRGALRVVFTASDLLALGFVMHDRPQRVAWLWLGIAVAILLAFFVTPGAARGEFWKFGLGLPLTIVILLLTARKTRRPFLSVSVLVVLAAAHLLLGYRDVAVVCAVVAIILMIRVPAQATTERRLIGWRIFAVVAFGVLLALIAVYGYDQLASSGLLGEKAANKSDFLAGRYGSLLSSRVEFFFSVREIIANPWFGGGSYSLPDSSITQAVVDQLASWSYSDVVNSLSNNGIVSYHSELPGMTAENGIFAMPFWIATGCVFIRGVEAVIRRESRWPELVAFLAVYGMWNLFFSPYGAGTRLIVTASLVTILVCTRRVVPGTRS